MRLTLLRERLPSFLLLTQHATYPKAKRTIKGGHRQDGMQVLPRICVASLLVVSICSEAGRVAGVRAGEVQ